MAASVFAAKADKQAEGHLPLRAKIKSGAGLQRRMVVSVPAAAVDKQVEERLRRAAGKVRMQGFRPGHVPLEVVRARYGPDIREEVLDEVMQSSLQQALTEKKIQLAGRPTVESRSAQSDPGLKFTAVFEVYPKVPLRRPWRMTVQRPAADIEEQDIDRLQERLRLQRAAWHTAERAAGEGDRVLFDYRGTCDTEQVTGRPACSAILGREPLPWELDTALCGMAAGEKRTLQRTLPADYPAEKLRGRSMELSVQMLRVEAPDLPPLEQEFFASFGVAEGGADAFRQRLRQELGKAAERAAAQRVKQQVLDILLAQHRRLEVPLALANAEIASMRRRMGAPAKEAEPAAAEPDEQLAAEARRRVKLGLILNAWIQSLQLKPEPARVRAMIDSEVAGYRDPDAMRNWYYKNEAALHTVESTVLEDQVVDHLLEKAKIRETRISCRALLEPDATADAGGSSDA